MPEHKQRILRVPYDFVMDFMRILAEGKGTCDAPVEVPPLGARVIAVHDDYVRHGFSVVLEHESFSPVPAGSVTPDLEAKKPGGIVIPGGTCTRFLHVSVAVEELT